MLAASARKEGEVAGALLGAAGAEELKILGKRLNTNGARWGVGAVGGPEAERGLDVSAGGASGLSGPDDKSGSI